jgi:hypothetical protein
MKIPFAACLVVIGLTTVAATVNAQNVSDATAPQVSDITVSPNSIDTTTGPKNFTVSVAATDDLSGVNYVYVYLTTLSTNQPNNTRSISCFAGSLYSGSRSAGVFTGTCSFPQYSQAGTWYVYAAQAYDNVGNNRYYSTPLPFSSGTIEVTAPTAPTAAVPTLVSIDITPASIDTTTGSATVTASAHITSVGNFNYAYAYLYDPTRTQPVTAFFSSGNRISGDANDGTYRASLTLPRYSHAGNWTWSYTLLYNTNGNYREYYNQVGGLFTYQYDGTSGQTTFLGTSGPVVTPDFLTVTSNPDVTGPTLAFLSLTPESIDVATSGRTVQVQVSATDDLSGYVGGGIFFVSPNGQQTRGAGFSATFGTGSIFFPQYSQAGNWPLYYLYLYDAIGNYRYYYPNTLPSGFPSSVQISSGLSVPGVSGPPGGTVTLNAVLTYLGSPLAGETIEFSLQGHVVGAAVTDATGTATLENVSIAAIASGTYVNAIGASFAGDGTHAAASGQGTLTVTSKLSQTITFAALADQPLSNSPLTLSATASSGLAVSYTTVGNCTASGGTLTLTAAGSCQVIASQSGNATYNAAPAVSRSFTITGKTDQTITFAALPSKVYGDGTFTVTASASSGLPVSFALGASSVGCSISGTTVTITGATPAGDACVIVASQTGSASYNAAPDVSRSFTIAKASQTIAFAALANKTYGDPAFDVTATASPSNLPVSFVATGGCTISAVTVTITGGGTCTITASQSGNANFNPALNVPQAFNVAYTWSNVLQPVNPEGTSVFKQGSTIPVKFQLTGSSAALTSLAARIWVAQVSNNVVGSEVEALSTSAADSGNTFRYDASGGQYIFNLSTKGLSQGTWQIRVDLLDNTSHFVLVSLRR